MTEFLNPEESLGQLDCHSVAALIGAICDVALLIGSDGVVRDFAVHNDALSLELRDLESWRGRPWVDCVTPDSRPKIEGLLRAEIDKTPLRHIQVEHPSRGSANLPMEYIARSLDDTGGLVALGHDLRKLFLQQQRLVDAQQSMEREYIRQRHIETRYRLLFESSAEAALVVDAATQKAVEVNPAARNLLGTGNKTLTGRPFLEFFDTQSGQTVQALLAIVRTAGRAEDVRARLAADSREVTLSALLFRQESGSQFLVRLLPVLPNAPVASGANSKLLLAVETAPDGFVVTDSDGRVVAANAAFLDLVQLASEEQVRGASLEQWLGRSRVDLGVLTAKLEQWGAVRLFATTLRGSYGAVAEVEISAAAVPQDGKNVYGFAVRDVGRRLAADSRVGRELPRSVEQLTELIGRVSLKDLVREATDMIERLCIEAALELTEDNRASAAELLGLSRQSLYLKMRRHGLGDLSPDGDDRS